MDISDLLASMQTDPGDRALARRVKQDAPTADGSEPADTSGAIPDPQGAPATDMNADGDTASEGVDMSQPQPQPDGAIPDTQKFADGGEVEGMREKERAQVRLEQNSDQPQKVARGAGPAIMDLPDDYDGSPNPANLDNPSVQVIKPGPSDDPAVQPGGEDYTGDAEQTQKWKERAHQAVNKGIAYGHSQHNPNAPLDADGTQEQSVRAMLSGAGATPHPQVQALEQAVDPDGTMDPSSRTLKAMGTAHDFYSQQGGPEAGAAAVHGLLQGKRKEFGHNAAGATVNNDNGNTDNAAKMAEATLNAVPDGLTATVGASAETATPTRRDAAKKAIRGAVGTAANVASKVGGAIASPVKTAADASNDYLDAPADQPTDKPAGAAYNVDLKDPDSGQSIYSASLTKEQLNHLMAHGWDKMLHGGTQAAVQEAAGTTENHNHIAGAARPNADALRPATQPGQQDVAELNGIPRGTNIRNMSVGQVSNMRQATAMGQVRSQPAKNLAAQEQTGKERTARITAGVNPDTGQREGDPTGRAAQTEAAHMRVIEADLKAWRDTQDKPPTPEQIGAMRQQLIQEHNKAYGTHIGMNTPAPQAQAPQAGSTFTPPAGKGWMKNSKTGQYRDPQGNIYDQNGKPVNK